MPEQQPKSFWTGVIAGIVGVCAIGFFITLPMALRKGGETVKSDENTNAVARVAPTPRVAGAEDPGTLPAAGNVKPASKDDHVRGDLAKAQVVLIEYSDFECPFCIRFDPTMQQVMKTYGDKVAWVYRHFPLSFHANAQKEAEASECAAELGGNTAFWKYADAIYSRTKGGGTGFPLTSLVPLAKELGLNEAKFKSCLDSGKYAAKVQSDMDSGQSAGVGCTPATILVTKSG